MRSEEGGLIFDPGQSLVSSSGELFVEFGRISTDTLTHYDIGNTVYGLFLSVQNVRREMAKGVTHQPPSKHPGILRDLSFSLDREYPVAELERVIRDYGTELLDRLSLYDLYEGEQIDEDQKGVTFSLFFRDQERTLEDKEVDDIVGRIISETSKRFGAKLR